MAVEPRELISTVPADAQVLRLPVRRARLPLADLVLLVDAWSLLAVLWATRIWAGSLDPLVTFYALALFALIAGPYARRERLLFQASDDLAAVVKNGVLAYAAGAAL